MINCNWVIKICVVTAFISTTTGLASARDLSRYNNGTPCTISVSVKKVGSMNLKGRAHEYPRSGFCCVAQPLAMKYKNPKVDQLMKQAVQAATADPPKYDTTISNLRKVLKITNLPDATRALFAANAAKNGATISQSKQLGDCQFSTGLGRWIRITGTGDTFGRF